MSGIEVFLIFVGVITVVCSFVFAEKLEKKDENTNGNVATISEEMVKEKVDRAIEEALDDKVEDTEARMDKLSNEKILAMGDYYKTVTDEISQNHEEVMFLYGMLNDKEKDIKNTVRDVENLKKSIVKIKDEVEQEKYFDEFEENANNEENVGNVENEEVVTGRDEEISNSGNSSKNKSDIDDKANNSKAAKDKDEYKKESADNRSTVENNSSKATEASGKKNKGVALSKNEARKKTNNNDKILELYNEGKTNMEIAKALGLGMGEVRLVIDLYKNR